MNRIEQRAIYMVVGILAGALVVLFTSGCNTVKGFAKDAYAAAEAIGAAAADDNDD